MIPGARHGCIEVRPVWDYGASPGAESRPDRRPSREPTDAPSAAEARSSAGSDAAHDAVDRLFREEQGRAVATLIRVTGDFDLAEEAVQDAFISALETWPQRGIPANPGAWITTTARNRAIDRLRRRAAPDREDRDAGTGGGTRDRAARHRDRPRGRDARSPMIGCA